MPGPAIKREVQRYRRNPVSVRTAMALILTATTLTVFASGVLMWVVDRDNFPNVGVALWWAIQTVTTVGYGDVVPTTTVGRVIGSFVLIESIAFLSIVTAVITSSFVEQARRQRQTKTGNRATATSQRCLPNSVPRWTTSRQAFVSFVEVPNHGAARADNASVSEALGRLNGGVLGGFLIWIIVKRGDLDTTGVFAANGWGSDIGSKFAAGLTLAMIHLATIPVDNTSVNPARSLGTAVFSGADAMKQLWAFFVFPLAGAIVGVFVWMVVHEPRLEPAPAS